GPYFNHMEMPAPLMAPATQVRALFDMDQVAVRQARQRHLEPGYQLGYNFHSINGRLLGKGEPIRVKRGERVLFHIVNASASELRNLALPGHAFHVLALDGNPVPRPADVPQLLLGPGERISATVTMNRPGIWVLGEPNEESREKGMGIVVEYAGATGRPVWEKPASYAWDYRVFARPGAAPSLPDETIEMIFATRYSAKAGFDEFTINGAAFSMAKMEPRFKLVHGRRYRLKLRNATDDAHPIHLHRHSFELTGVAGAPTAGVKKDVALIGGFQEMTLDFTADQPGLSLFHCHMQPHMDFGFMALFDCA
ncbi:MAG: multicopper oxidase domain-containing protein, partial [Alphaproteobacteria bacterium]|nr:multicopper oxidase domain-containing protein [Alphaproteobacteria bacterium]